MNKINCFSRFTLYKFIQIFDITIGIQNKNELMTRKMELNSNIQKVNKEHFVRYSVDSRKC